LNLGWRSVQQAAISSFRVYEGTSAFGVWAKSSSDWRELPGSRAGSTRIVSGMAMPGLLGCRRRPRYAVRHPGPFGRDGNQAKLRAILHRGATGEARQILAYRCDGRQDCMGEMIRQPDQTVVLMASRGTVATRRRRERPAGSRQYGWARGSGEGVDARH
jgi:hypothetical protein